MPTTPLPDESDEPLVPASVLRLILEGIRDVAGSQFPRVLEQADLQRYRDALPPADTTPTITHSHLSRLYGTTHRVVGETLTRVFLTNYGRRLPESVLGSAIGQGMYEAMEGVPEAKRLAHAVRVVADTGSRFGVEVVLTEDAEAYYLTVEECAICADIRDARSPVCANSEYFYGTMVKTLSGVRVTALEIECRAQGARHCRYRIRK